MIRVQLTTKRGDTEGRTFLDIPATLAYILDTPYEACAAWYNGARIPTESLFLALERERMRRIDAATPTPIESL